MAIALFRNAFSNLKAQNKLTAVRRTMATTNSPMLKVSQRISATDTPCIVEMQNMLRGTEGVLSLAQGIVHWAPPREALKTAMNSVESRATSLYGADDGMLELREALCERLYQECNLDQFSKHNRADAQPDQKRHVMVNSGANQAYTNIVLSLLDGDDTSSESVIFRPYYFNHVMCHQMTGLSSNLVIGACHEDTLHPDVEWLKTRFENSPSRIRMVTLVNPSNPAGVLLPRTSLEQVADLCEVYGCWLVVDNTYEQFVFDGIRHHVLDRPNVINIFSFSKAYGLMGWRVGYTAFVGDHLRNSLLKAQDTIVICPSMISQTIALAALTQGSSWVNERVVGLDSNRKLLRAALCEALGNSNVKGGEAAIYFLAKLPIMDDKKAVEFLAKRFKVCVIPGSSCGMPGWIRVCFGNLEVDPCREAAKRLHDGLVALTVSLGNAVTS